MIASLRRLQEEDPTIDLHRDQQTGEQIVAGLSQVHVEVIVDRLKSRFGVEVTLKPPRVPYQETIRRPAAAHGRHKKQSGGRGQFGDCQIEIEPLADLIDGDGFEFIDQIKGGVIPHSFIPAVEKGVREAMQSGVLAGYPVKGVRVRLFDGQHHSVDSSEIAFKLAGLQAMKQALELADPVLLEPIMLVTLSVPEAHVGDVIGDLNSRRGRPQGMEPVGAMTEIRAEVPMAEMLTYAPDLRSITAGQGDYTMEFLRYEEVPGTSRRRSSSSASERARRRPRAEAHRAAPAPAPGYPDRPMATRTIVTSQPDVACDVCERRLLRGEQPDVFLAAGRRRTVCELCAPRAAHEGWLRERDSQSVTLPPMRPRRGRSLLDRLRQAAQPRARRRRARRADAAEPSTSWPHAGAERSRLRIARAASGRAGGRAGRRGRRTASAQEPPACEPSRPPTSGAAGRRGVQPQRVPAPVAGVARSLGAPEVSVRSAEHLASVVTIVVAWELCWYRYEVDLERRAGRQAQVLAQGTELGELAREERLANAVAADAGALTLLRRLTARAHALASAGR